MVVIDPATIKVPDAAAWAAHDVFWNARFKGEPIDLELEFDKLFHYVVAAAIAAWPRIEIHTDGTEDWIELTLMQEKNNADG
jgi:hypothetical protein